MLDRVLTRGQCLFGRGKKQQYLEADGHHSSLLIDNIFCFLLCCSQLPGNLKMQDEGRDYNYKRSRVL